MIAIERNINIKSPIMQSEMTLENIGNPYFEAFNIISSDKRFLNDSKELKRDSISSKNFIKSWI
jgi:hypothetical protein